MAPSKLIRPGKCKPDTVFMRKFPGKRRFERVSEDDWNVPLPHKDIAGFGHILRLEADVRAWAPGGQLQIAKKWPARSYIRNFARLLRNVFGQSVQLVDRTGASQTTTLLAAGGATGMALIAEVEPNTTGSLTTNLNPELSGAAMAIGDGVAAENHQRNDLVNRVGGIYSARQNLVTTVLTTATTTFQITTGITNATSASFNVTEIGLFLFAQTNGGTARSKTPFATLLAYDGVTSTPVASGGVIAPRYTMDFPV